MSLAANPTTRYLAVAPVVRGGFLVLGAFALGLGTWSSLAGLSGAVIAPAVVVPEGKRKTIQHSTLGIVDAIFVVEGERVQAGQPLLKLDDVPARASHESLRSQYLAAVAREGRLLAEMRRLSTIPDRPNAEPEIQAFLEQEQRFFDSRRKAREGEETILHHRIRQLQEEISGNTKLLKAARREYTLTEEEKAGVQSLAAEGYAPRVKLLQYDRSLARIEGEIGSRQGDIAKAQQKISETENEITQIDKRLNEDVTNSLREVQIQLQDLRPRLAAAQHSLEQILVVSPISGHVLDLAVSTVGGVVEPGKPLMDIVPVESTAIIEAQVQPQNIDEISAGQKGIVHMTGRPGGGTLPMQATVTMVSADRLTDQRTGVPYYAIKMQIDPGETDKILPTHLIPGMTMEVVLPIRKRTLLEYLVDPLRNRMRKAMRER
ncbi:MAG: HlyD family secretion protein [Rhodospirillaceae bacterium]|nr:MAG: HlyD family secretion protein [Rhodospirillaceae bacterium]